MHFSLEEAGSHLVWVELDPIAVEVTRNGAVVDDDVARVDLVAVSGKIVSEVIAVSRGTNSRLGIVVELVAG